MNKKHIEVERSIIKKFRKDIWSKIRVGLKDYKLINNGDKVAVCMSGGKDSFLLAKSLQELKKHGQIDFDLEFIVMNPGYTNENLNLIKENLTTLNIPAKIFESDIFKVVDSVSGAPCYLCARMRRGFLYAKAKELGCNKIALGHHFDDVIETILLSMLYSGEIRTMMPKLHSANFENMELIRPLYLVKEKAIINWSEYNNLKFLDCACKMTARKSFDNQGKRNEMKNLISQFRKTNPYIEMNIFRSVENIQLDAIVGYKTKSIAHNFLDNYDEF